MSLKNVFSLFLLLVSIFYFSIALSFEFYTSSNTPGDGFFPQIVGFLLILLTGYDFVKNFRRSQAESVSLTYIKDFVMLIVISTLYIFTFNILGALLSAIIFTLVVLLIFNQGKWKQNIIISLLMPGIIYFMFDILLNTGLPQGIFEHIF